MKALLFVLILIPSVCLASQKDSKEFDQFVEGALTIYSQFQEPSKKESEEFYKHIKSHWAESQCSAKCSAWGSLVAEDYVQQKKIKIKPKPVVQNPK